MITLISFFFALIVGMPIFYLMIFSSFIVLQEMDLTILYQIIPQQLFRSVEKEGFLAIAMFMLVGELMNEGGITRRLMDLADLFVGRFRAGLAYVNLLTNIMASAILGSATAQISMMTRVMVPSMVMKGYDKDYSTGLTVASGMLGPIIPPSMVMIIYAIIAYQSAAALFMAGVFPGLLIAGGFCLTIYFLGFFYDYPPPTKRSKNSPSAMSTIIQGFVPLTIPIVIIFGVVSGIMTPTESGAAGSAFAFLLGWTIFRELKIKNLPDIFLRVGLNSAMIISIIGASSIFGWVLGYAGIPDKITKLMISISDNPMIFLLMVNVLIIILGMFLDALGMMVITVPILLPIAIHYNIDPIHFGVIISLCTLIGAVSPPVGTGLYIAMDATGLTIGRVFRSVIPFVIAMLICMVFINAIPSLCIWLPKILKLY